MILSRDKAQQRVLIAMLTVVALIGMSVVFKALSSGVLFGLLLLSVTISIALAYQLATLGEKNLEQAESLEKLQRHDELTQLYQRRYFLDLAQQHVSLAQRYDIPVSMLLLRLESEGFQMVKPYALKTFARLVQHSLRETDMVSRFQDNDILVLMPHTEKADAESVSQRMIESLPVMLMQKCELAELPGVGSSLAYSPGHSAILTELIQQLYQQISSQSYSKNSSNPRIISVRDIFDEDESDLFEDTKVEDINFDDTIKLPQVI
ncbi:MAG: diguanylate cyclase [Deinococcales bacterium]